jgi:hypothetical protein
MSADLDRLEAIAKAATPGPWRNAGHDGHGGMRVESIQWQIGYVSRAGGKQEANAEHIATFSPSRVLALLAVARAATALAPAMDECQEIARVWEPDDSSGKQRQWLVRGRDATRALRTALAGLEQLEDRNG